jgi:predicted dehydrogenase
MMITVGIAGCGWITEHSHLPALMKIPEMRVVALADPLRERRTQIAERFGIRLHSDSVEELLRVADPDVVAVCTPTMSHAPTALSVLKAGKHLFLEKPAAVDLKQVRELECAVANARGLTLLGFPFRRYAMLLKAREYLRQVQDHDPAFISSIFSVRRSNISASAVMDGPLLDLGSHHFDLWRFLLEDEVEILSSHVTNTHATVAARLVRRGTLLEGIFAHGDSEIHEFDFHLKQGRLHLDLYRKEGFEFLQGGEFSGDALVRTRRALQFLRSSAQIGRVADSLTAYIAAWSHFAKCILSNQQTDCPLSEGVRTMEIYAHALEKTSRVAQNEEKARV